MNSFAYLQYDLPYRAKEDFYMLEYKKTCFGQSRIGLNE